jgi:hypothetical protein
MTILNLFSSFKLDNEFKSSEDWNKVLFAKKYLYMYREIFQKLHLAVPACCAGFFIQPLFQDDVELYMLITCFRGIFGFKHELLTYRF